MRLDLKSKVNTTFYNAQISRSVFFTPEQNFFMVTLSHSLTDVSLFLIDILFFNT